MSVTGFSSTFGGPPDIYADAVQIRFSPFGLVLEMGLSTDAPNESRTQVIVRMSPQHAKVFSQLLRNSVRAYEAQVGPISLPDAIYEELKIDRED
jgi:hypothetical protein